MPRVLLSGLAAAALAVSGCVPLVTFDNGVGAPSETLPHLTQAFYQGDGKLDRAHEGSGIGLYIANAYVDQHGGKLEFESESGFTARIWIPATAPAEKQQDVAFLKSA